MEALMKSHNLKLTGALHPLPQVQGRFKVSFRAKAQEDPLSKKSFDRTFVVIPGPNGSMIVASDTLLIRPYTSDFPWKVQNCLPIQLPLHQVFQLPQLRHHSHNNNYNSTTSTTWYRTNYSRFTSRYKGSIKSNTTRVVGEDIARDKVKH